MSMTYVKNKAFKNETVPLDDIHYIRCKFEACTLLFAGGEWGWTECTFKNCSFRFGGPAQRTAGLIKFIEKTIKGGQAAIAPPESVN